MKQIRKINSKQKDARFAASSYLLFKNGTPGAISFEHLLGWLDQLRVALEDEDSTHSGL